MHVCVMCVSLHDCRTGRLDCVSTCHAYNRLISMHSTCAKQLGICKKNAVSSRTFPVRSVSSDRVNMHDKELACEYKKQLYLNSYAFQSIQLSHSDKPVTMIAES